MDPQPLQPIPGLHFTAIDFEIANSKYRSACSLGLVRVRDGLITESKYWLIKPDPFEMGIFQKKAHRINLEDLADKPTFKDLWPEIGPYLESETLVAHNTAFDMGVLRQLGDFYDLDGQYLTEFCTLKASPNCWPDLENYKLPTLCAHLGITLDHHNALSDALACAFIAIQIINHTGMHDIANYARELEAKRYEVRLQSTHDFFRKKNGVSDIDTADLPFGPIDPACWTWVTKRVLITGTFESFPDRSKLMTFIESEGGKMASGINSKNDVVIIGHGAGPSKIAKLKKLLNEGCSITLLNEDLLNQLVP